MHFIDTYLYCQDIIYNDYIKILQTVCPRNEYMNKQPAGGNGQTPATGNGQTTPQPAATGNG